MEAQLYLKKQEELSSRYESLCLRCGACCGVSDGDPCANLRNDDGSGRYYCAAYESRLGPQKTVSGKLFTCVSIREVLKFDSPYLGCAYAKSGSGKIKN